MYVNLYMSTFIRCVWQAGSIQSACCPLFRILLREIHHPGGRSRSPASPRFAARGTWFQPFTLAGCSTSSLVRSRAGFYITVHSWFIILTLHSCLVIAFELGKWFQPWITNSLTHSPAFLISPIQQLPTIQITTIINYLNMSPLSDFVTYSYHTWWHMYVPLLADSGS